MSFFIFKNIFSYSQQCKTIDFLLFDSIFHIMAKINSGAIFVLLLPNVIFLALTMYTTEHVTISKIFSQFLYSIEFPFKYLKKTIFSMNKFCFISTYIGYNGLGFNCFSYCMYGMLIVLAIHLLSLCNDDN